MHLLSGVAIALSMELIVLAGTASAQNATDRLGDALPPGATQRLGTLRMKYPDGIADLAYLPDGRGLIAVGRDLQIWDLGEGRLLETIQVAEHGMDKMQFGRKQIHLSADGGRLLLRDGPELVEYDLVGRRELHRFAVDQTGWSWAMYSPDETRVLTTGLAPPTLKEFELATGRELITIKGDFDVFHAAAYGPDGATAFVAGGFDYNVAHYDLRTGQKLHEFLKDYRAYNLLLSPDGERLLVGSRSMATEWKIEGYEELQRFTGHHGGTVKTLVYCHEPEQILTGSRDGSIRRWNREAAEVLVRWVPHQSLVKAQALSPDGRYVLSEGGGLVTESEIATGEPRIKWERHGGAVAAVAFLPDGEHVVSASTDATLRVWDVVTGRTVRTIDGVEATYCIAVSPDGRRVAAGCKDSVLREFSLDSGQPLRQLTGHLGFVRSVAYTADGTRLLSSADDGSVRVWSADGPEPIAVLKGHRGGVLAVALSPDDRLVATGGRDGDVRIWDLAQARLRHRLQGHRGLVEAVAFSDADTLLSAASDGRVLKWSAASGEPIACMTHSTWLHALAVSAGNGQVYAAGADSVIARWDLADGEPTGQWPGHEASVSSLAVSPDGSRMVSASSDTTLLVWNLR